MPSQSTALQVVEPEVLEPGQRSLEELAAVATKAHEAVIAHGTSMLDRMVEAGEALNDAKRRIPRAQWGNWRRANFPGSAMMASVYMRAAENQDMLREGGATTETEVRELLPKTRLRAVGPPLWWPKAEGLLASGHSLSYVARVVGVHRNTVKRWWSRRDREKSNEYARKAYKRDKRARAALERQERDRAMSRVGGDVAKCYSEIRKLALLAERTAENETGEVQEAVYRALMKLYQAEDELVKAVGAK